MARWKQPPDKTIKPLFGPNRQLQCFQITIPLSVAWTNIAVVIAKELLSLLLLLFLLLLLLLLLFLFLFLA